jgi:hypothetical protein
MERYVRGNIVLWDTTANVVQQSETILGGGMSMVSQRLSEPSAAS